MREMKHPLDYCESVSLEVYGEHVIRINAHVRAKHEEAAVTLLFHSTTASPFTVKPLLPPTVLYIAYLLWSWAERTLRDKFPGMTLQQALNSLSDVSIVRFQSNKSIHRWTTRLTDEQEKLLNLFGATKHLPQP